MADLRMIFVLIGMLLSLGVVRSQDNTTAQWPLHNNGLTDLVEWDHYSFLINGERLFVFSGEFHYWRYPVPELWRDLLEKVKAAGFNAISIYNHWGYHNPTPGVLDFESGAHNFTSIMTLAKDVGLYMIIRPGPYVNAEANAGGFPLWITTGEYGALRNNDLRYTNAWKPYTSGLAQLIAPHLITNGGNVVLYQIENELEGQWTNIDKKIGNPSIQEYMQLIEDNARANGINVPLTYNAPGMNGYSWSKDFSNATGNVDVVGLDSYPSCWSCNLSECTGTNGEYFAYQTANYYDYFTKQSPTQPNFMPEFQGGSYNPWGGPQGGCPENIGADFANMFYRNLIYQKVTAVSLYMLFGGTSWGWLAAPVVASSYDYSSPISENRVIGSKYYETKLLTQFTRVAKDLAHTNRLGNSTGYSSNPAIAASELRNPDTGAAFYVTMHATSTSSTLETFSLDVSTSAGPLTVPQYGGLITLNGHQSKIIVTDFKFGNKNLLYSTAEVLTYAIIDGKEVLAVWTPGGESGELTIDGVNSAKTVSNSSTVVKVYPGTTDVTISFSQNARMSLVELGDGSRVVILDRASAYKLWSPALDSNPAAAGNDTILVHGPYLVRSAAINQDELSLMGDITNATTITILAPKTVKSVTWNGKRLNTSSISEGLLTAKISGPEDFELPKLSGWKYTDSLPEIQTDYSADSKAWVVASNKSTSNPTPPAPNNPVLYVDDYHIHAGVHIYRALFLSTPDPPTDVFLNIAGGTAFGYSAWLNGDFIGSWLGRSWIDTQGSTFSFANASLSKDGDNVLIVVMDNSGHDQRTAALNPRGISNATLIGPAGEYSFREWKIAGTAGREDLIDPVRGPLNEGGLYAERIGAHLPGFSDQDWTAVASNITTLTVAGAGVRVFRTVVPLDVPAGLDVSISFSLSAPSNETFVSTTGATNQLRALLFVNGYQYGRFNPYIGNQIHYPVPTGILHYGGDNTIAVTVWSQSADGAELKVEWNVDYVHETSYDFSFDSEYLSPGWSEQRLQYA